VRKKWLILPLGAALAVVVFLAWCVAEDARQEAIPRARVLAAHDRWNRAVYRFYLARVRCVRARDRVDQLTQDGAPADDILQARADFEAARREAETTGRECGAAEGEFSVASKEYLRAYFQRQEASWPVRLRQEVRRRTGW